VSYLIGNIKQSEKVVAPIEAAETNLDVALLALGTSNFALNAGSPYRRHFLQECIAWVDTWASVD